MCRVAGDVLLRICHSSRAHLLERKEEERGKKKRQSINANQVADKLVSNEQQQQEELHSCPVRGSINISSTSERHRSISDPERQSARRALNNMTGDDDGPLVVAAENKHRHTKTGDAERGTRRRPLRRGQSEQSESVIHFFSLFLTHTVPGH